MFNYDSHGVILSNDGSNGDSAHHSIYVMFMKSVLDSNHIPTGEEMMERFYKDGGYARHPIRETNDFSRDQFTPFLAYNAAFLQGQNQHVNEYYNKIKANWGFFFNEYTSGFEKKPWWNRDLLDPATRGLFLRGQAKKSWKLYFTDLHFFTSIVFRIIKVWNDPNSTADENLQIHLLVGKMRHETWLMKLSAYVYFKYRPDNDGGKGWRGAIADFWDRGGTYWPDLIPLTISAIEKVFKF